jgi:hypothetical protein
LQHTKFISIHFCSECDSEWFDCIGEDEKYITEEENFYQNCSAETRDSDVPIELLEVTKDRCFENRKCEADPEGEEVFVGGNSQCTCADLAVTLNRTSTSSERYKRQTGEVFITSANVARVFKAQLGGTRLARDSQQLTRRKGDYRLIRQRFIDYTESFDEEEFDIIK